MKHNLWDCLEKEKFRAIDFLYILSIVLLLLFLYFGRNPVLGCPTIYFCISYHGNLMYDIIDLETDLKWRFSW